jgi:hypothetical protein
MYRTTPCGEPVTLARGHQLTYLNVRHVRAVSSPRICSLSHQGNMSSGRQWNIFRYGNGFLASAMSARHAA